MSVDYYELLAIPATATESEIRRAYRKTSLLYHPDKVTPTAETLEKFQLLQTALRTLTDAEDKVKYDQERKARQMRAAETAALDSRRRQMVEDLEKGESAYVHGVKRTLSDRELKIKRIAEENRQRRKVAMEQRAQAAREAMAQRAPPARTTDATHVTDATQVAEEESDRADRTVKVHWIKEGAGLEMDRETLEANFAAGDVDTVLVLQDKRRRVEGRDKKVLLGRAFIVFKTLATAKKVVARGPWDGVESVDWIATKEADGG